MKRLKSLFAFGLEFVVGDDWVSAVGVVAALGLTAAIAGIAPAWWVMPLAVPALLAFSVWRVARVKT